MHRPTPLPSPFLLVGAGHPRRVGLVRQDEFRQNAQTGQVVIRFDQERQELHQAAIREGEIFRRDTAAKTFWDLDRRRRPLPVNDAAPADQLRNCALCAVAALLDRRSGDIAEALGATRQNQSSRVFGRSLNGVAQRHGIDTFLRGQAAGRAVVRDKTPRSPQCIVDHLLGTYSEGTRFLLDGSAHFLYGEIFRDDLFVVDYQPNVAGGIPPLYGRNSLPWTLPALVIPTLTYWALLPRMPGRRRRRLALLHSSTQRQTGP